MTERLMPYWLVTFSVFFAGLKRDKWQPAVCVCGSHRAAEKRASLFLQSPHHRDPEISGPFYKKVPA